MSLVSGIVSYALPDDNNHCFACHLRKHLAMNQGERHVRFTPDFNHHCIQPVFYFDQSFSDIWYPNFSISCEHKFQPHHCKKLPSRSRASIFTVEIIDFCFQGIQTWGLPNIPIGFVAMVTNFVVMATVALTPSLFKKANMVLIANLGIGDFLQGLWLVIISIVRYSTSSLEYFNNKMPYLCYSLFALFLTSQSLTTAVSLIITIERYLCIVYSTKPNIRITRKIAVALLIAVWVFTIIVASTPVALKMISGYGDYSCINLHTGNNVFYLRSVSYVTIISYILSYILYARIFYTVRQSSLNAGIQREGKLARRIITVISTNLLLLFGPIIAGQILVALYDITWTAKSICWNAVLLWFLGINSIFNPVLYAFRIEKFRRSFKRLMKGRRNEVGIATSNN